MWDGSLCVRFFDVNQSVDDPPGIVCAGLTWLPHAGVRDRLGKAPGYYIEYRQTNSVSIRTLRRIGRPNGRKISVLFPPDPARSAKHDPRSHKSQPFIPENPNKRQQ